MQPKQRIITDGVLSAIVLRRVAPATTVMGGRRWSDWRGLCFVLSDKLLAVCLVWGRFGTSHPQPLPFLIIAQQADDDLLKSIQKFWTLPINAQVIIVATLSGKISQENLSNSLQAIIISNNIRNKAVHEGVIPGQMMKTYISGLLNTVAALLFGSNFKLPSARLGNKIMSMENWQKESQ